MWIVCSASAFSHFWDATCALRHGFVLFSYWIRRYRFLRLKIINLYRNGIFLVHRYIYNMYFGSAWRSHSYRGRNLSQPDLTRFPVLFLMYMHRTDMSVFIDPSNWHVELCPPQHKAFDWLIAHYDYPTLIMIGQREVGGYAFT